MGVHCVVCHLLCAPHAISTCFTSGWVFPKAMGSESCKTIQAKEKKDWVQQENGNWCNTKTGEVYVAGDSKENWVQQETDGDSKKNWVQREGGNWCNTNTGEVYGAVTDDNPGPAVTAAHAYTGRPLKILCLHGGNMTADGFKGMLAGLARHCGAVVDFVYAQAPHRSTKHGSQESFLWMGKDEKTSEEMWVPTLRYLQEVIEQQGPFDGVLGYSMGSCVAASLLAAVPDGTFRFALLSAGYAPTTTPSIMASLASRKPLRVASLHMHGAHDFIPKTMLDELMAYFDESSRELCAHPGGHDLPRDSQHVEQFVEFVLRFTPRGDAS